MKRWLAILGLLLLVNNACKEEPSNLVQPDYAPHLLKGGNYVRLKGKAVDMDSTVPPPLVPAKAVYELARSVPYTPQSDYAEIDVKGIPIKGKWVKTNMDTVEAPIFVEAKNIKVSVRWPRSIPAGSEINTNNTFPFSFLTTENGMLNDFITTLIEDRFGRIWMGTWDSGINIWNGNSLVHLDESNGLPHNSVICLLEDKSGQIWIGTKQGLCVYDGREITKFTGGKGLEKCNVRTLIEDQSSGLIWIGTENGLYRWDGDHFSYFTKDQGLDNNDITSLMQFNNEGIWIGTSTGINHWDGTAFNNYLFESVEGIGSVCSLHQDDNGRIWILTTSGVYLKEETDFKKLENLTGGSLFSKKVFLEDGQGQIWIGSWGGGLYRFDGDQFVQFTRNDGLARDQIMELLEDSGGRILIGTPGGGLTIWQDDDMVRYPVIGQVKDYNNILHLMEDQQGRIWMALQGFGVSYWDGKGFGLFNSENGLTRNLPSSIFQAKDGKIWIGNYDAVDVWDGKGFTHFTKESGDLLGGNHTSILEDCEGKIWIASINGINVWDPEAFGGRGGFEHYTTEQGLSHNEVWHLLRASNCSIWIGTNGGGINIWDPDAQDGQGGFTHFNEETGFYESNIRDLYEDPQGNIWIASSGNGVQVWDGKGFTYYKEAQGLSDFMTSSMMDRQGNLWLGGKTGLTQILIDPETRDSVIRKYDVSEGLIGSHVVITEIDRNDNLWIVSTAGLSRLDLQDLSPDTTKPRVFVAELQPLFDAVDWQSVHERKEAGEDPNPKSDISAYVQIDFDSVFAFRNLPFHPRFPSQINHLTIRWAGIQWSSPHRLQYTYYLEGKDRRWSPLTKDNSITYEELRPGRYTFHVQAFGHNGQRSEIASYSFSVLPPWWLTIWAKVIYFLFLISVIYGIIRWRTAKQRKKLLRTEQLNERLQQIDKLKDQFLANTSHELRTPLQGIIGLSETIIEETDNPDHRENLAMIISSGKRLNHLVNDILDFSKLKNFDIELLCKPVNLRVLAEIVLHNNAPLIKGKKLEMINGIPAELPDVYGDENRLQQILYNLIGNAIKFTESGYIKINAEERQNKIQVTVEDTGTGIPKNKQADIFREFEQGDGSIVREFTGTGLGLSISKKLVELHGGEMWVESKIGQGSTFFFTLPVSTQKATTISPDLSLVQKVQSTAPLLNKISPISALTNNRKDVFQVLVVDDEPINQQVLKNHLSGKNFQLTQAMNGEEALKVINEKPKFDLVLLDVMMPHMSGYEVCQKIREKYLPSELPIIMITAKNQLEDIVQGLSFGANDYLPKPFHKEELLARINTQMDLKNIFSVAGRFVPNEFLHALNRTRLTEVALGDYMEQEVTVLFADIRDYTRLAETMTPEENFRFVNAFHGRMGPIIQQNQGFINQYLGDAIMAIFPDSPAHGLQTAIEMQQALRKYNEKRQTDGRQSIKMGIGLHTGPLIMGIIGDRNRMDAATIADTVNTASRIEGLTKYYGSSILLSDDSIIQISDTVNAHFRYLGKVRVKGKKEPVELYECYDGDDRELAILKAKTQNDFKKGLEQFFNREFPEAAATFSSILRVNDRDQPARLFMNKASEFLLKGVPEDWTGVDEMTFK